MMATWTLRVSWLAVVLCGVAVRGTTGQNILGDIQFELFNKDWQEANDEYDSMTSDMNELKEALDIDSDARDMRQTMSQSMSIVSADLAIPMPQSSMHEVHEVEQKLQKLKEEVAQSLHQLQAIKRLARRNGWRRIERKADRLIGKLRTLLTFLQYLFEYCKHLCKLWCGGDPHIRQPVKGSITPFFYDVRGQHGEDYLILDIPAMGLTISGTLKSMDGHYYFGELTILAYKQIAIGLDAHKITIDGNEYTWGQNTVTTDVEGNAVQVDMGASEAIITVGQETLTIRNEGEYMNMFTFLNIPNNAGGFMGEMHQYSRISYDENGASLVLRDIAKHTTTKLPLVNEETSLRLRDHKDPAFSDFMHKHCISCDKT